MTGLRQRGVGSTGLTLIELVVVLAIVSVSAVLVLPSVGRGTQSLLLRSEAGRVAAMLREARQHAVSQRRPTRVTLDTARNTVVLTAGDPDHPLRRLEVRPELHLRVATGSDVLSFSSRGLTRETRWIVEGPGGRRLAIDVQAVSGRVTVAPDQSS
jgi:prepilin-type N-terminal cleavage/methylation domain-containing protein